VDRNEIKIECLGTSIAISVEAEPAYLENLLRRYKAVIESTQKKTNIPDPLKIAILTGFLLCDEIEKLEMKGVSGEKEEKDAEKIAQDLIARIDDVLEKSPQINTDEKI
jgi:cell division protein ZapA (FtsZ GTPase activity inhibitor)